jgi:hypothetical protein
MGCDVIRGRFVIGAPRLCGNFHQHMMNANDHNGLATYYTQQAQEMRAKAKQ